MYIKVTIKKKKANVAKGLERLATSSKSKSVAKNIKTNWKQKSAKGYLKAKVAKI